MNKHLLIVFLVIIFCSCSKMPRPVRIALEAAGGNRSELEKVIGNYNQNPADSLKLRAAYFLIGNMPGKFYYEGELLDAYSKYLQLISEDQVRNKLILDSISGIYGPMSVSRLNVKWDIEELTAEFLIKNIDMAFKVWQEQPWGKDISFEQFCENILPYRVGNERPEYDRREIYHMYDSLLDPVRMTGGTAIDACSAINNELIKEGWEFTHDFSSFPEFPAGTLLKYRKGNCREMTGTAIFIIRALGIPVTSDFTPQWANRSLGHEWNVVLDREGKNHVFMGSSNNPGSTGQKNVFDARRAVVYRKTFARQPQSLAMVKKKNDRVPPFFENPHLKDVSEEYFKHYTGNIALNKKEAEGAGFAYACVFNNETWVPVSWGKIIKEKAVFPKLSCNIMYLPAYYTRNNELLPAGDPFILTPEGKEKYIKAVVSRKEDMLLRRKYPLPWYTGNMGGGKFQGSAYADFRNSTDLYKIPEKDSSLTWQEIDLKTTRAFRYYRYIGPDGSCASVAELEFYVNSKKTNDTPICGSKWDLMPRYALENVNDGDILTFFESDKVNGAWVGMDFGRKVKIDRIRYMPRTDDNSVVKGEVYELVYRDDDQWISAGIQTAGSDNYLMYKDMPSGALYLLHNLTKGKEERIFTYENGKQVWW